LPKKCLVLVSHESRTTAAMVSNFAGPTVQAATG